MKIVVTSDCHGNADYLKKLPDFEKNIGWLVHCGDSCGVEHKMGYIFQESRLAMCAGNCDMTSALKEYVTFEAGGHKFLVIHGNQVMGYQHRRLAYLGKRQGCDVVLCGHTHVPFVDREDPEVLLVNPGSITLPRQEGRQKSYAVLDLKDNGEISAEIRFLDELQMG